MAKHIATLVAIHIPTTTLITSASSFQRAIKVKGTIIFYEADRQQHLMTNLPATGYWSKWHQVYLSYSMVIFSKEAGTARRWSFHTSRSHIVYSSDGSKGRKGMDETPFYGYSLLSDEAVSWSLEAYLNDFGTAQMAKALRQE